MATSDPGQTRPPRPRTPTSALERALSRISPFPLPLPAPGQPSSSGKSPGAQGACQQLRLLPTILPPFSFQQAWKRPECPPPRSPEGAYRAGAPSAVSWVRWGEVLAHARCIDYALACPSAGAQGLVRQCLKGCAPTALGVRAPSTVPTLKLVAVWGVQAPLDPQPCAAAASRVRLTLKGEN